MMAWNDIDRDIATPEQVKYAHVLCEALYGEIQPVEKMTKSQISKYISDMKIKAEEQGINLAPYFGTEEYKPRMPRRRR